MIKVTVHEFKGGACVLSEDGDEKTSTCYLQPGGPYDYGYAGREQVFTFTRGKGTIAGMKVSKCAIAVVPRGQKIVFTVEEGSVLGYDCEFGAKIFHPIFSRTPAEAGFSEKAIEILTEAGFHNLGDLVRVDAMGGFGQILGEVLGKLEELGLHWGMNEDRMLVWSATHAV